MLSVRESHQEQQELGQVGDKNLDETKSPRKRKRKRVKKSDPISTNENAFFTIDVKPGSVKKKKRFDVQPTVESSSNSSESEQEEGQLVDDLHLSISDFTPRPSAPPSEIDQAERSILEELEAEQAGADNSANGVRYFMAATEEQRVKGTHECTRCNQAGHAIRDCPVIQCTTCGKLDDHEFRQCPLNRVCRRCGQKGHIQQDCNVRPQALERDCALCGSPLHKSRTCPTVWRRYTEELDSAEPLDHKPITFACYNCGETAVARGHFGTECPLPRGNPMRVPEPCVFTSASLIGPLASRNPGRPLPMPAPSHRRFDWERSPESPGIPDNRDQQWGAPDPRSRRPRPAYLPRDWSPPPARRPSPPSKPARRPNIVNGVNTSVHRHNLPPRPSQRERSPPPYSRKERKRSHDAHEEDDEDAFFAARRAASESGGRRKQEAVRQANFADQQRMAKLKPRKRGVFKLEKRGETGYIGNRHPPKLEIDSADQRQIQGALHRVPDKPTGSKSLIDRIVLPSPHGNRPRYDGGYMQ